MPPNDAILILICAYVGAIYGGSRTAILLNIPGTAANAAACLDGYQLARKGQAGRAMGIATSRLGRGHRCSASCAWRCSRPRSARSRCPSAPSSSSGWRCSA